MSEEQIELLRKWIRAEIDYAIDWHKESYHGGDSTESDRALDFIFKEVLKSGLASND